MMQHSGPEPAKFECSGQLFTIIIQEPLKSFNQRLWYVLFYRRTTSESMLRINKIIMKAVGEFYPRIIAAGLTVTLGGRSETI